MSGRSGDGRGGSILTPQIINQLALALGLLSKENAVNNRRVRKKYLHVIFTTCVVQ